MLAGAFGYALVCVVPTFEAVPLPVHLAFRTALMDMNGIFMQGLMGLSLLAAAGFAFFLTDRARRWGAGAAALLTLTSFLVTRLGNVPINGEIRGWSATNPPADWVERLQRWEVFHEMRTAAAIGAFIVLLLVTESVRGAVPATTGIRDTAS
ncbi:MAG: DUF1772 domain-containing protein [Actinoplanes sp.]